jgi:hypothetical protein
MVRELRNRVIAPDTEPASGPERADTPRGIKTEEIDIPTSSSDEPVEVESGSLSSVPALAEKVEVPTLSYSDVVRGRSQSPELREAQENPKGEIVNRSSNVVDSSDEYYSEQSEANPVEGKYMFRDAETDPENNWHRVGSCGKHYKIKRVRSGSNLKKSVSKGNQIEISTNDTVQSKKNMDIDTPMSDPEILPEYQAEMDAMFRTAYGKKPIYTNGTNGNAEAGPSKGKNVDLGNFGKLNLSEREIDPEEQRKALELWKAIKAINDKENKTTENFQRIVKPTESPPMVQSNPFDEIPPPDYSYPLAKGSASDQLYSLSLPPTKPREWDPDRILERNGSGWCTPKGGWLPGEFERANDHFIKTGKVGFGHQYNVEKSNQLYEKLLKIQAERDRKKSKVPNISKLEKKQGKLDEARTLQKKIDEYNFRSLKEHQLHEEERLRSKSFVPIASYPAKANVKREFERSNTLKPIEQLNLKGYIGRALRINSPNGDDDPDSSDYPNSSDSSSTLSESSKDGYWEETPPSTHLSDDEELARLKRKLNKKYEHYLRKQKLKRTLIKPQPPDVYDGTPDSRLFHKFVMQSTAYVRDGRVARRKQVFTLMNYLKDKVYEFYVLEVSYNPENWDLNKFFQALFDFCFPVNYRSEIRRKLRNARQGTRKIKEFVYELREYSSMIGHVDERELVN